MVHVTGNFQNEAPLSPFVAGALADAFAQGWADPRKLSQSGARARILADECIQSLASTIGVLPQEIEIIGESNLGFFLAISGLLKPESRLYYGAVDRKEIHAVAKAHSSSIQMPVGLSGAIDVTDIPAGSVVSLQAANGETGIIQNLETLAASCEGSAIAYDFSAAGTLVALPQRWDSAFFDPKAWQGPQGLGILAISESASWRNPLPHLGALRVPSSYSLPLLMASTLALQEWKRNEVEESTRLRTLTSEFRKLIRARLTDCDIAGEAGNSLPHITSLSFLYVEGEELLRALEKRGLSVDSGSACTAEDLAPSHVLSAMGLLTHGNVRITFHSGTSHAQMTSLVEAIYETVAELRRD